ncbi:hydrogenase small subunit [Humidesulfovibrio sp.]
MKVSVGHGLSGADKRLEERGISRRDFMKFCGTIAAAMGMGPAFAPKIAAALTADNRPSVIWLHNAECTGCSESILRTAAPYIDALILDVISLEYQETIMAAAGEMAEKALHDAMKKPYLCVVEGAIPVKDGGIYGMVGGHTMLDICKKVIPGALATIAYGTCATYGGVQAAKPNPTDSKGVDEVFPKATIINIPGCPPNPVNLVGTVIAAIDTVVNKKPLPKLDDLKRPLIFFGETVHDKCERLPFFEKDQFAMSFESKEAKEGWCLYKLGCKGPYTYNNCPTKKFNPLDKGVGVNWPVQAGHPCIGCSEPKFWDTMSPFYEEQK